MLKNKNKEILNAKERRKIKTKNELKKIILKINVKGNQERMNVCMYVWRNIYKGYEHFIENRKRKKEKETKKKTTLE